MTAAHSASFDVAGQISANIGYGFEYSGDRVVDFFVDGNLASGGSGTPGDPWADFTAINALSGAALRDKTIGIHGLIEDELVVPTATVNTCLRSYGNVRGTVDGATDVSPTWTNVSGDIYFADAVSITADAGVIINDNNCHNRNTYADMIDATMYALSDGFVKFWDAANDEARGIVMYVQTDGTVPASGNTRITSRTNCLNVNASDGFTLTEVICQRANVNNIFFDGGLDNLTVDDIETRECGDGSAGRNGLDLSGASNVDLSTGIVVQKINSHNLHNGNGNAIEIAHLDGALFQDNRLHDCSGNAFELFETCNNCMFTRNRQWNVTKHYWFANDPGPETYDGNRVWNNVCHSEAAYSNSTTDDQGDVFLDYDIGTNNWFYNNSVYLTDNYWMVGDYGGSSTIKLFNNAVHMVRANNNSWPVLSVDLLGTFRFEDGTMETNNNVFFNAIGDANQNWHDGSVSSAHTFAQVQTDGQETDSVQGDPIFASVTAETFDLAVTIAGAGATLGVGDSATQPAKDYISSARVRTDSGAYEAT